VVRPGPPTGRVPNVEMALLNPDIRVWKIFDSAAGRFANKIVLANPDIRVSIPDIRVSMSN
jgi:hypothetical protein